MTFLAPALLALGVAAAVPVALHLFQRHQGPRVVFPAIRYLQRAERESAARLRLRQLLLLALRVLAVILIAAAAARPFLPVGGAGHHPTSVVIVLDNSLSTGAVVGDRRVLDHLKAAALATIAASGPDDRLWLVHAAEPWQPAVTGVPEEVALAVRAAEPSSTGADLVAQVERAGSILATESRDRAREIHLLSDLRATAFASPAAPRNGYPVLVMDPPVAVTANRAVTAVEINGGIPPRAGEPAALAATIAGFGPDGGAAADTVDVRLVMDGTVRAVTRAPVGTAATLPLPARGPGLVAGRVEIDGDALTADDRRHFAVDVRPAPIVELGAPAPFVEEALAVLADAGRIRLGRAGPGDVLIAPGGLGLEAVRRGVSVLVLPPASPLEVGATNQRLAAAGIPRRLGPPTAGEGRLAAEGSGLERVLYDARLRQAYPIEAAGVPGDTVLVRLRTGEPWAVAGPAEPGRYMILGSPLTPEAGTLPTSVAMLPLLDRAVNAWATDRVSDAEYHPGAVVTLPPGDSVLRPDGLRDEAADGVLYRLVQAGVYRVIRSDTVVAAFAVNAPAVASDVRRLEQAGVLRMFPGRDVSVVGPRTWERRIFTQRLGRDISIPLLLMAALLLLVEAALAAAGRRRVTRAPGVGSAAAEPAVTAEGR
jgi:hypothetical protein